MQSCRLRLRLAYSLAVFVLAIWMGVPATAQSKPLAHPDQPNAIPNIQGKNAGGGAEFPPAGLEPELAFGKVFGKPVSYDSGGWLAYSIAIGDLNGDGRLDLVVANYCQGDNCLVPNDNAEVSVLLNNGDGSFQTAVSYDAGVYYTQAVAIGDLNGDGHPDIVVASRCQSKSDCPGSGSGGVGILMGNGDGTFQSPVIYSSGGIYAASVAIADLNGDGKLDLVVANGCLDVDCGGGGVSVLMGNGDGTFQPAIVYNSGGVGAVSVTIVDLSGNGKLDLVVANGCQGVDQHGDCTGTGEVSVLMGIGDGTFQPPVSYGSGGYYPTSLATGDLNGDGYPDLVVINPCTNSICSGGGFGVVGVLLGNGDGTFQGAVSYNAGYAVSSVAIGDMNGDGQPDLLVTGSDGRDYNSGVVRVLMGNGGGTFQGPESYRSGGSGAVSVAIADLNGDGKPDAAVANKCGKLTGHHCSNGVVGVLLNKFTVKTTTRVASSPDPSHVNQAVTFTATVASTPPVPAGEVVTFYSDGSEIGTSTTTNGVATLTTSFSTPGRYVIEASYPGDVYHLASSRTVKQVVKQ